MLQAAHHPNVQHLMAEERMKPLKCPSPVTVAAAHIAAKHGVVVKMRGTMGSPGGQAPGDSEASGGENDATFFVFEDDKENVDPKTGVSARLSSGAGSRSDEFEVAFGVPRDPARVAEAAVGAPSRQPLADVTARYVTPTARLSVGKAVIKADEQGLSNRVRVIRATDENAAPNGERESAKPGLSTIGLKRPEGPGLDPAKRRRVLRFVIR
ncbi:predicted protein [Micromonas commoda]|uniref:Uncharacterized protein n=1 Tax=Micromonas commoda (strain RCC299 / NOUM17 / CCMP2709) TaxID=296587 RepID=C1EJF5_MICCC|nr:predicted protein [Micromonas commoda]ACO68175.1 predicted protein [Micromonas commoda]|eukprot:XP_002506917.1 predicted protein [Micromonas commoda]